MTNSRWTDNPAQTAYALRGDARDLPALEGLHQGGAGSDFDEELLPRATCGRNGQA